MGNHDTPREAPDMCLAWRYPAQFPRPRFPKNPRGTTKNGIIEGEKFVGVPTGQPSRKQRARILASMPRSPYKPCPCPSDINNNRGFSTLDAEIQYKRAQLIIAAEKKAAATKNNEPKDTTHG